MIVVKENIQRIIDDNDYSKFKKMGFHKIGYVQSDVSKKEKSLSKMNSTELKSLAESIGLENFDSLTNKELVAIIKEKQNNG